MCSYNRVEVTEENSLNFKTDQQKLSNTNNRGKRLSNLSSDHSVSCVSHFILPSPTPSQFVAYRVALHRFLEARITSSLACSPHQLMSNSPGSSVGTIKSSPQTLSSKFNGRPGYSSQSLPNHPAHLFPKSLQSSCLHYCCQGQPVIELLSLPQSSSSPLA